MFGLFNKSPVLEASSSQWLFDAFAWALVNFDADYFYNETVLVLPNNEFFPGSVDSPEAMANLIFDQVKVYAGISHWPTRLVEEGSSASLDAPNVEIKGALRGADGIADDSVDDAQRLPILFYPQQISNPEGMISTFSYIIAHHLGQMADEQPPGGSEYWPHVTELLAIYTGFGVMFANSAFTYSGGGCASCYNPAANRDAYLSEREATYALAIFSVLKDIPGSDITRHMKGHLRGVFKKAVKEIKGRDNDLQRLRRCGANKLSTTA